MKRLPASSWEEIWEAGPYYQRISELLEDASDYAVFAGWQIDSRLPMPRPKRPSQIGDAIPPHETLKEKVLRLCEEKPNLHFYFLMWDHAYFFVVERETWQGRIWENVHPRVHFLFDNRHPFGGSHHEKVAIIDGKVALVGGIDLCDERWDSPEHFFYDPRRSLSLKKESHGPYHDLAVQVTGPICAEIQKQIERRWMNLSTVPFPEAREIPIHARKDGGIDGHVVGLSRTQASVDAGVEGTPIVREIEFLYRDMIRVAERRLILENQYYWSPEINDLLMTKMHEMEGKPFEIILILTDLKDIPSLTRKMGVYQLSLLEKLEKTAAATGTRLILGCPYVYPPSEKLPQEPRERTPKAVYIHSKTMIADDRFLTIGSANLASRALRLDTEMNLTLEGVNETDRAHIRHFADHVLRHWNITEDQPLSHTIDLQADVQLRLFRPSIELRELKRKYFISSRLPLPLFLDPIVPWTYPLKRKFRVLAKRQLWIVLSILLLLLIAGGALSVSIAGNWRGHALWSILYGGLLSTVWLLPVPFFTTALWSTLQLGLEPSIRLMASSLWVAALIGYGLTRMFPTPAASYYRETGPKWLPMRIGLRRFPILISVLADPRVSIRSKIAFQGLYTVPFPWFALGTGLILPSVIYAACRFAAFPVFVPVARLARELAPYFFLLISGLSFIPVLVRLWKRKA